MTRPKIRGGTCEIYPLQWCIVWSAYQEGAISWLALKVWCAAWLIQKSRCKQQKDGTPYRFQTSELHTFFKKVRQKELDEALHELEAVNLLRFSNTAIWFATSLDDIEDEQVKTCATEMFEQLHENNRTKRMKFPRRILKLIVQCGQKVVRVATMLGLLLRLMLVKRYDDYKGCVKAEWIANLFGVSRHRVNTERTKLINEGLFRRLPTPQQVRQKYGEWVALNLTASEATEPGENPADDAPNVESPEAENVPKVEAPSNNQVLSSPEENLGNQILATDDPGTLQQKTPQEPTWNNITLEDLRNDTRSEVLRQEAIQNGYLSKTRPDQTNFFAAIAHALRVAKTNACGLLRTIVEKGLWQFISQADEYNGVARLRRCTEDQGTKTAEQVHENLLVMANTDRVGQVDEQPTTLSEDAIIVQTITADLQKAGVTGEVFRVVQRHGYLQNWDKERWVKAEQELAQARLLHARQRHQAMDMTRVQEVIEEGIHEDDPHCDWG